MALLAVTKCIIYHCAKLTFICIAVSLADVRARAIAISRGRQRQRSPATRHRIAGSAHSPLQKKQGRSMTLDVNKLNVLLKTIDTGWQLPSPMSRRPSGSNFQFRKTCERIYSNRHKACNQITFGIMCFNHCYEKGKKTVALLVFSPWLAGSTPAD